MFLVTRLPWTFPARAAAPRAAGHGTTASSAPMTTTTSVSTRSGRERFYIILNMVKWLRFEFIPFVCLASLISNMNPDLKWSLCSAGRVTAAGQSLTWFCSVALQGPDFMQTLMLQIGDMRLCHQLQATEIQGCYDNCDDNSCKCSTTATSTTITKS